jgi:hypothetical protein
MADSDYLSWFYRLFHGNGKFYVRHQPPFRKEGNKTLAKKVVYAKKGDAFLPVTEELYREHLNGKGGLAVAPIIDFVKVGEAQHTNVCYYALIDIDVYDANFTWLVRRLYDAGFKFAAFPSKSGGLHIYFLFCEPEPAAEVMAALNSVVTVFGMRKMFVSGTVSKVEVFPEKAVCAPGVSLPKCVFLPFYNSVGRSKQGLLTVDNKMLQIVKAKPIINTMFTTLKEMQDVLKALPYGDAPYCIQMVMLTGALGEGEGRNNFLFSAAVYLKKKYGENFYTHLTEMNGRLQDPIDEHSLKTTYESVMKKEYHYKCASFPCDAYCDKQECKLREFSGVKKDRGNTYTGADCWGLLTKYVAEEPYYLWEIRVAPGESFRTVKIDSVDDLRNQLVVQKRCWRDLNWAPYQVKDNEWIEQVNRAMRGIEDRQIIVPKETDTSELSDLRNCFIRFLTHRQVKDGQPYLLQTDRVYHGGGAYYFTHTGFKEYLRLAKVSLGRLNLREWLISQGCEEGEISWELRKGRTYIKKCWKRPDTEELLAMEVVYEDIYEGDEDVLRRDTEQREEGPDETLF